MRTTRVSLVMCVTLAAACGDDDGGSLPLADVPGALEDELCAKAVECGRAPDQATCEATTFFFDSGGTAELQAAIDRGTIVYDAAAAADCVQAFGDAFPCTVTEALALDGDFEAPQSCQDAIRGQVPAGGSCLITEECVGGVAGEAECVPADGCTMDCCMGTCMAADAEPPPASQGQPCTRDFFGSGCADGLYCKPATPDAETGTCEPQVAEGACDSPDACQLPRICALDPQTGTGTCYRPAAEGQPCDPALGFVACDRTDNYCDTADSTCKRRRLPGESCALAEFSDNCVDYAWCDGAMCVAFPTEGQPCGGPEGGECMGDLDCNGTTCVAPGGGDPPCTGA